LTYYTPFVKVKSESVFEALCGLAGRVKKGLIVYISFDDIV
jgi:hypothetical protein